LIIMLIVLLLSEAVEQVKASLGDDSVGSSMLEEGRLRSFDTASESIPLLSTRLLDSAEGHDVEDQHIKDKEETPALYKKPELSLLTAFKDGSSWGRTVDNNAISQPLCIMTAAGGRGEPNEDQKGLWVRRVFGESGVPALTSAVQVDSTAEIENGGNPQS
jgi:hypothetical protein